MKNSSEILYLHGLGSSGEITAALLRTVYPDVRVHRYFPHEYQQTYESIKAMENTGLKAVIGTSMGGYWALKAAAILCCRFIAINPVTDPKRQLASFLAFGPVTDYVNNKPVTYTAEHLRPFDALDGRWLEQVRDKRNDVIIMSGKLDNLVPPQLSAAFAQQYGFEHVSVPGMGHRLDEAGLKKMENYLD